jgi:SAM-dependent methyltransferase
MMSSRVRDAARLLLSPRRAVRWAVKAWRQVGHALGRPGDGRRRAQAMWGEDAVRRASGERPRAWTSSHQVLFGYIFPRFGTNWYEYIRRRYCPRPREMGLSLCCGDGSLERRLVRMGIIGACEGVDFSPQVIAVCKREAEAAGLSTITYRAADLERIRLPANAYDVVLGWMGLHHIRDLERLYREVKRALRPDGIFVVNEYIGPSRFQMPQAQVDLINEWLGRLPAELRRLPSGEVRERFARPTPEEVMAADPTEAVSSDQIVPLLERHFGIVERLDYGGVLLQWVLHDVIQNFDPRDSEHREWLERLYRAEEEILGRGVLKSDFSFMIAQRQGG